jgi:hypothetical protein
LPQDPLRVFQFRGAARSPEGSFLSRQLRAVTQPLQGPWQEGPAGEIYLPASPAGTWTAHSWVILFVSYCYLFLLLIYNSWF